MARISDNSLEKEIDRAMGYISIGCIKIFENDEIDRENIKEIVSGMHMVQTGANILNALSKVKAKDTKSDGSYFPNEIREVLHLAQNCSVDEWVEKYPFLRGHCTELEEKRVNFYNQAFMDSEDRDITERNEYNLYVKFNNDIAFSEIRNMANNDKEYTFSRAYISPVLDGELIELKQNLAYRYVEIYGESIPDSLVNKILTSYYKPINSLEKYYSKNGRYAICRSCGSLMLKEKNGRITCSFDRCRASHYKRNKRFEISGYCTNPTRTLRYEVMRFVYFPSIEEKDMFDKLNKKYQKKNLIRDLILYKGKDSCDISFYIGDKREAVDLKEWEMPEHLAKALNDDNFKRNNADANCTIVIPDYLTKKSDGRKNDYMQRLKAAVTGEKMRDVKIMTVSEFFKYIDGLIRK